MILYPYGLSGTIEKQLMCPLNIKYVKSQVIYAMSDKRIQQRVNEYEIGQFEEKILLVQNNMQKLDFIDEVIFNYKDYKGKTITEINFEIIIESAVLLLEGEANTWKPEDLFTKNNKGIKYLAEQKDIYHNPEIGGLGNKTKYDADDRGLYQGNISFTQNNYRHFDKDNGGLREGGDRVFIRPLITSRSARGNNNSFFTRFTREK
jgi:hypothetical protein